MGLKECVIPGKLDHEHQSTWLIDYRLPDIIAKYGCKKPLMIFCITRKSAQSTAKLLANLWTSKDPGGRQWPGPTQRIVASDPELTGKFGCFS